MTSEASTTAAAKPIPKKQASTVSLDVSSLVAPMKGLNGVNFTYQWRMAQLKQLHRLVMNHFDEWTTALEKDLGKSMVEAVATELLMVKMDLELTMSKLKTWMQPKPVPSPGVMLPCTSQVETRPLTGPVLIIGPFNYPVSLILHPLIGVLAAGNPALLKPSELTPNVAKAFAELVPKYFSPDVVNVVTGGIPETTALLQHPWGKVFFTGSPRVGKLVSAAAAKTLTPVVLELGGKCPAYVDLESQKDIQRVADRIVWSKLLNAGQTCAATDTVIVHERLLKSFLPAIKIAMERCGDDPKIPELGRIVSEKHAERLFKMIVAAEEDDKAKVIFGGSKLCDVKARFIYPTAIVHATGDSKLMGEEIFGPILPIIAVKSREAAIEYMQTKMPGTPLCLYIFCRSDSVFQEIKRSVPAGSVVRNDALLHLASPYIPFGGLSTSGYGQYHGHYSFECFSHKLPVIDRHMYTGSDLCMARYPPFGDETSWKSWLVRNVVVSLPALPVIRPWQLVGVAVVVVISVVPACKIWLLQMLIQFLEQVLVWLK